MVRQLDKGAQALQQLPNTGSLRPAQPHTQVQQAYHNTIPEAATTQLPTPLSGRADNIVDIVDANSSAKNGHGPSTNDVPGYLAG